MDFFRKVKPRQLPAEAILWIIMAPFLLIIIVLFGFGFLLLVPIGLVYGITNLILFIRSRNWGYLLLSFCFLLAAAFSVIIVFRHVIDPGWITLIGILIFAGLCGVIYLGMSGKLKWLSYEVLELAARPVEEVREGYTGRPIPVGRIEFNNQEMAGFARFIRRRLIAVPIIEPDKILFLVTHSRFSLIMADRYSSEETYVCFHVNGNVTANISRDDYLKYQDSYAFDQLCMNLGKLFIRFYSSWRENKQNEILNDLKPTH